MKLKKLFTGLFAVTAIAVLILDAKTAIAGAGEGLELCIQTVIPSLFPFFVFTNLLTTTVMGHRITALKWFCRIFSIPSGAESLLIIGILGGYPVGAQCISQAYHSGQLSKEDAHRLLGFCSNAGPSFIFGILGSMFSVYRAVWLIWIIHVASALITGLFISGKAKTNLCSVSQKTSSLPAALKSAVAALAVVCGWIILFKTILSFLTRWFLWMLPNAMKIILMGVTELTNGCIMLNDITSESMRFVICSALLSLGGICVAMQTISVTGSLGTGWYFPGKIFQCILSVVLSIPTAAMIYPDQAGYVMRLLPVAGMVFVVCSLFLQQKKGKIAVAFPKIFVYNKEKC